MAPIGNTQTLHAKHNRVPDAISDANNAGVFNRIG